MNLLGTNAYAVVTHLKCPTERISMSMHNVNSGTNKQKKDRNKEKRVREKNITKTIMLSGVVKCCLPLYGT